MSFEFKPCSTSMIKEYSSLLSTVFDKPGLFTPQYLDWQYVKNPSGTVFGFDAFSAQNLAAHYVTIPFESKISGTIGKGLLSLNTATHKPYQGKGLFTQLASKTYQLAAEEGYQYVIGVANQNSVHGFVKKLGFKNLGKLDAFVGIGEIKLKSPSSFLMSNNWNPEALNWRIQNPVANYFSYGNSIYSKTAYPLISAQLFQSSSESIPFAKNKKPLIKLFIGNKHNIQSQTGFFKDIPDSLRPSPLHLIYLPLQANMTMPRYKDIFFQALDFDAY